MASATVTQSPHVVCQKAGLDPTLKFCLSKHALTKQVMTDANRQGRQSSGRTRQRPVRDCVEFSVKGPVSINFDEEVLAPGCSVLDILLTSPSSVRELVFRNYYTAWLTLLVRLDSKEQTGGDTMWVLGISHRKLMPVPHLEDGSQDLISILASESLVEWQNIVAIRLVLRQPSAIWKTFHVEELSVYSDLPRRNVRRIESSRSPNRGQVYGSLLELLCEQTKASLSHCSKKAQAQEGTSSKENAQVGYEFFSLPQV